MNSHLSSLADAGIAWWLQQHNRSLLEENRYAWDFSQLFPQGGRLRGNTVVETICVTHDTRDALCICIFDLPVIAFPPFEGFGEVCSRLSCWSTLIQALYAALCDHWMAEVSTLTPGTAER